MISTSCQYYNQSDHLVNQRRRKKRFVSSVLPLFTTTVGGDVVGVDFRNRRKRRIIKSDVIEMNADDYRY